MASCQRRAVLADLSLRGCRILSHWAVPIGRRIGVTIPRNAGVAEPLTVKGRVVRMGLDEHLGPDGPYSAAVAFADPMPAEVRSELEWLLEDRLRGPATLADDREDAPRQRERPRSRPEPTIVLEDALDPPETREAGRRYLTSSLAREIDEVELSGVLP